MPPWSWWEGRASPCLLPRSALAGFFRGFSHLSVGLEMRHSGQGRQEGVLPSFLARMQQEWRVVVTQRFISGPDENRETGCFIQEEKTKH